MEKEIRILLSRKTNQNQPGIKREKTTHPRKKDYMQKKGSRRQKGITKKSGTYGLECGPPRYYTRNLKTTRQSRSMHKMRHDQPYVETVSQGCCNLHSWTKETILNPETRIRRILIKQTSSISNTKDTKPSSSTDQSDSQTQIIGNRHGRVINSTCRHHWRRQVGIQV